MRLAVGGGGGGGGSLGAGANGGGGGGGRIGHCVRSPCPNPGTTPAFAIGDGGAGGINSPSTPTDGSNGGTTYYGYIENNVMNFVTVGNFGEKGGKFINLVGAAGGLGMPSGQTTPSSPSNMEALGGVSGISWTGVMLGAGGNGGICNLPVPPSAQITQNGRPGNAGAILIALYR